MNDDLREKTLRRAEIVVDVLKIVSGVALMIFGALITWHYAFASSTTVGYGVGGTHGSGATLGSVGGFHELGQKFTVSANKSTDSADFYLQRNGSPSDSLGFQVCLWTSTTVPCGSVLATATIAAANIPTTSGRVAADLNTTITLSTGTNYFVRFYRTGSYGSANYDVMNVSSATTTDVASYVNQDRNSSDVWENTAGTGSLVNWQLYQVPHVYGPVQDVASTIFSPAPTDLIRSDDLDFGLDAGVASALNSGSTTRTVTFNWVYAKTDPVPYFIESATSQPSNFTYQGKYANLHHFRPTGIGGGTYSLWAQTCLDEFCGTPASMTFTVISSATTSPDNHPPPVGGGGGSWGDDGLPGFLRPQEPQLRSFNDCVTIETFDPIYALLHGFSTIRSAASCILGTALYNVKQVPPFSIIAGIPQNMAYVMDAATGTVQLYFDAPHVAGDDGHAGRLWLYDSTSSTRGFMGSAPVSFWTVVNKRERQAYYFLTLVSMVLLAIYLKNHL